MKDFVKKSFIISQKRLFFVRNDEVLLFFTVKKMFFVQSIQKIAKLYYS